MQNIFSLAVLPGLTAATVSFLATPLVIAIAWKIGIIDNPKTHKHPKVIHTYPVPRGGGLAIFAGILAAIVIFLPLDKHLKGILAGLVIITVMGILDDKYDLNPYLRLVAQFIAAACPIAAGIGISFISNPAGGIIDVSNPRITFNFLGQPHSIWIVADLLALFWIVTLMNFINWGAKGVDGQLPGVVTIAAATIAVMSLKFSADITQWPVVILAAIVAGAYLGFLPWNFYPQKIMPAFAGSNIAGYLLGILSILATTKVGILMVVLCVPLVDSGYTIVRRIAAGKSPFWGDRGHLHHRLLDLGWSKPKIAISYWLATLLLGILALNLNTSTKFYTMIGIIIVLGGLILWLTYRPKIQKNK
jgi:UDP-GlcNAc:undecaprenyl-phosphate GlcNAc-1-phosphate transferase